MKLLVRNLLGSDFSVTALPSVGGVNLGTPIPPSNKPAPYKYLEYTVTPSIASGYLKFEYTTKPTGYVNRERKALMLQVPTPSAGKQYGIKLNLGSNISWHFPMSAPAVYLNGKSNTDTGLTEPEMRYADCAISPDRKSLTFTTEHVTLHDSAGKPIVNFDGINILVEVDQEDGSSLLLVIDPDIKNPGDDLKSGGSGSKRAVRRKRS